MLAVHPACVPVPVVTAPSVLPVVGQNATEPAGAGLVQLVVVVYLIESAKYASSAVTKLRRSDFIEAMYAFSFVLANLGIAIAAKMPIITTTISSSINVKPLRFMLISLVGVKRVQKRNSAGDDSGKAHAVSWFSLAKARHSRRLRTC